METALSVPPLVVGATIAAGVVGLLWGWFIYQRCPHCGRLVRRVERGWRRCGGCGRQYRKGLRVR